MLTVDPDLPTPPFEQLKRQIIDQRDSGRFPAEHRLPPVRRLADQLGVSPTTVARAYRELEAEGIIETRGRHGSFVTGTAESAQRAARHAAQEFAAAIRRLHIDERTAVALVREAFATRDDLSP